MEKQLREKVFHLVDAHGGQRPFALMLGISQSTVSRFLSSENAELHPALAKALARRFPGLKRDIDAVFFGSEMHPTQAGPA